MKGLLKTTIVMAVLIVVGIGISAYVYTDLVNRLAVAHERGGEDGYQEGYVAGLEEGSRLGYQAGGKIGYLRSNEGNSPGGDETGFYFLYNPTYNDVREMLAEREDTLAEGERDSAEKTHNYAEANGIRAAYVRSQIARKAAEGMVYLYELVAFETIDRGLVIIEPSSHREVKVEVGKSYSELNGLPARGYDDTITKVTIVW